MSMSNSKDDDDGFRDQLTAEEPKIDAALKSYCSWMLAQQRLFPREALQFTRTLSKTINSHVCAIRPESHQQSLTAQVWNNHAITDHIKITKSLGRTSLRYAWADLDRSGFQEDDEETQDFLQTFERLLMNDSDPDAPLIWDTADQQDELARRAAERHDRAKRAREEAAIRPMIEELQEDEEGVVCPMIEELEEEE
jgi:hypothetical protein